MRYQKIYSQIWHDEKFIALSEDAKFLFFYLLTSPHNNSVGLYILPRQYALADLNWKAQRFNKPFMELLRLDFIMYDETVRLLCIKNHLKHNTLENENQSKAAAKVVATLPKSSLYSDIFEQLKKPFHKPLIEQLKKQYGEPETETETGTETKTEEKELIPQKLFLGEHRNVRLTKEERSKLKEITHKFDLDKAIESLSDYLKSSGKQYKSHYATLRGWLRRDGSLKIEKKEKSMNEEEKALIMFEQAKKNPYKEIGELVDSWRALHKRYPNMGWDGLLKERGIQP